MEGVEGTTKSEAHLTSAAAFVEGGIQEACDDACSICLESFCESDPSSVTSCRHEFHLQCILECLGGELGERLHPIVPPKTAMNEFLVLERESTSIAKLCQRSSQCPMCWQSLSLKDPASQELLEAVESERSSRLCPSRNATIFHHPTLGDFELQHLPIGTNDVELEDHIIQHLAAAAAMGRRQIARREGRQNRSSQGRPPILVFSGHPNAPTASGNSSFPTQRGGGEPVSPISVSIPSANLGQDSPQLIAPASTDVQADSTSASVSGSGVLAANAQGNSLSNRSPNHSSTSSQESQDRAGPSDFQSFSESFKSKFNAVSMRYKESISKSTRGWKERFFSRNSTMADLGSEVRREVNAGIATVSQMMERLETRDTSRTSNASVPNGEDHNTVAELDNQRTLEAGGASHLNDTTTPSNNMQTSCAAGSGLG